VFTTWKVSFQQITKPHPDSYSFVWNCLVWIENTNFFRR
jgi:hypothetical protein